MRPAGAHSWRCKSSRELATANEVKRNCGRATDRGEEAWSVNREPMNKNRIRGTAKQGERARSREALVAKARRCISGGCAVKECVLTRGYLALCLKGQRGNTERKGEALPDVTSDETGLPRRESEGAGRGLLEQVFARENMQRAWKRVKANKGAAGRHPETGRK